MTNDDDMREIEAALHLYAGAVYMHNDDLWQKREDRLLALIRQKLAVDGKVTRFTPVTEEGAADVNNYEQRVWDAVQQLAGKREDWIRAQAKAMGMTPEQVAQRFDLETRMETVADGLSVRFVDHVRLVPKEQGR